MNTNSKQVLPNLFVVGAMKSASTTLHMHLSESKNIVMCSVKEPNHFCTDLFEHPEFPFALTKYKHFNEAWIKDRQEYLSLFPSANSQTKWMGEASPTYLYSRQAAENIFQFNPDARIVCLLRNPVDRAYSEYLMNMVKGLVGSQYRGGDEFLHVVHQHYAKYLRNDISLFERYIDAGMYYEQLERYFSKFPRDQIFVAAIDRPGTSMSDVLKSLATFLAVEIPAGRGARWNAAYMPRMPGLNALLHQTGIKNFTSLQFPKAFKNIFKPTYYETRRSGANLGERAYLANVYKDDVRKLGELLKQDFSYWLVPPAAA